MTWMDWTLVGLFALAALATVGNVGKPRPTITPTFAAVQVAINAALIVGVVVVR